MAADVKAIAGRLLDAYDRAVLIEPICESEPDFDVDRAYEVLSIIERHRRDAGWVPVGRKIGFTNRTLWDLYGVSTPLWARVWDRTLIEARNATAEVSLAGLVQPRIEVEVAFRTAAPIAPTDDPMAVLEAAEWIAPAFEIVQCHYPDWKFALPDCTAAFGLHGRLIVGPPLQITDVNRMEIAEALPLARVTLSRDGEAVDEGVGSNVLDGPAHALAHLTRVLDQQSQFEPVGPGEVVTTGTITDAWPVESGQTWTSDYGALGLAGLTVTFR